jgi:hypothetical protein
MIIPTIRPSLRDLSALHSFANPYHKAIAVPEGRPYGTIRPSLRDLIAVPEGRPYGSSSRTNGPPRKVPEGRPYGSPRGAALYKFRQS